MHREMPSSLPQPIHRAALQPIRRTALQPIRRTALQPIRRAAPRSLSDDDLLANLAGLVRDSRRVEADLVAHVAEVDARRLYCREACPSMFAYCTERLQLSEAEAYLRITVARASREYPSLLPLLAAGRLHLSALARLAPHLTPENHQAVLARAEGRSKREIEELIAALAPRPDAATAIRRLPDGSRLGTAATQSVRVSASVARPCEGPGHSSEAPGRAFEPPGRSSEDPGRSSEPPRPLAPAPSAASVVPLSPGRYKVQFTADEDLRQKLDRLRALMRSTVPDGDLAGLIAVAVTEKLQRLEARRLGSPRSDGRSAAGAGSSAPAAARCSTPADAARSTPTGAARSTPADAACSTPTGAACSGAMSTRRPERSSPRSARKSRHIPAAVRRAVWARDGGRCRFTDEHGRRCSAREGLEFHHRHPYGYGGEHTAENVRLLCRAHNAHVASADFGETRGGTRGNSFRNESSRRMSSQQSNA